MGDFLTRRVTFESEHPPLTQMGQRGRTCRPSCTGLPGTGTGASHIASPRTTPVSRGTVCPEHTGAQECARQAFIGIFRFVFYQNVK